MLGLVLAILGVLALIAASLAYAYQQTILVSYQADIHFQLPELTNPYRGYTFPLILLSVALLVIGFAFIVYRPKIKNQIKSN
jgi:uncharacterized membrane protein HdeD (DUF308 family)